MDNRGAATVEALIAKGVEIPNPSTVDITDDVDPEPQLVTGESIDAGRPPMRNRLGVVLYARRKARLNTSVPANPAFQAIRSTGHEVSVSMAAARSRRRRRTV